MRASSSYNVEGNTDMNAWLFLAVFLLLFSGLVTFVRTVWDHLSARELDEALSNESDRKRAEQFRDYAFEPELSLQWSQWIGVLVAVGLLFDVLRHHELWVQAGYWFGFAFSTVLILVIGKALGARLHERTGGFAVQSLFVLAMFWKPLTAFSYLIYHAVSGGDTGQEESTRDDIDELLEAAHEDGEIDEDEYRLLKNIMRFSDVYVSDVMTPRTVMFAADSSKNIATVSRDPNIVRYSRFPVFEAGEHDNVIGYAMTRDVLWAVIQGKGEEPIRNLVREVYFIPDNIQLDRALEDFLQRREHLFVVVDEHGSVDGIITMEDVVETILGAEIIDEVDTIADLRTLAKQRRDRRIGRQ